MKKNKERGKRWIGIGSYLFTWIIGIIIISGAGLFFIFHELTQNRIYFLDLCTAKQEVVTNQIGNSLNMLYEQNASINELIQYIEKNVETSGSSYPCLSNRAKILYVKDKNTTDKLLDDMSLNSYVHSLKNKYIITSMDFGIEQCYTISIITEKQSLLDLGKVRKHEAYTVMDFIVFTILFMIVSILLAMVFIIKNEKIRRLQNQLITQNKKLEAVTNELSITQEESESVRNEVGDDTGLYYDMNIVQSLLKKSDNEKLRPFTLIFIKLIFEDRYFEKDRVLQMVKPIHDLMKHQWIMTEVGKGEFLLLLYRTTENEVKQLKDEIYQTGLRRIQEEDLKVRMGSVTVGEKDIALEVFYQLQKKIREGI